MAQEVTLGGDRLGSGKLMKQELYNYGMNSFNQSRSWGSSMAPGILYPCFKEIGTNHGTFDIDINPFVRTLPTKGPLFGSFKMQIDLFTVPFRLYQGILHNNPVDIGLNMNQVYLPVINFETIDGKTAPRVNGSTEDDCQVSTSALIKYMGISGAGHNANYDLTNQLVIREFQCVPELGYYDIFKNYYSNKQEENAYVITPGDITEELTPTITGFAKWENYQWIFADEKRWILNYDVSYKYRYKIEVNNCESILDQIAFNIKSQPSDDSVSLNLRQLSTDNYVTLLGGDNRTYYIFEFTLQNLNNIRQNFFTQGDQYMTIEPGEVSQNQSAITNASIALTPFALKNIDKMRAKLLANNELGDKVIISDEEDDTNTWGSNSGEDGTGMPYYALVKKTNNNITWNAFEQNGLVVKTYQSDLFNNWLDSSFVDTIAQRTKIDTTSGGFTPDTLILQEKIYKLLNRILVSGGTYYDWQEATYGEGVARMCEIPMYIGGMSTEIMFEEVVSNSASMAEGRYQALGSLGGRGHNTQEKGGRNIHVRMDEPGYIIGICSLTPRIAVSQGNEWDRTELKTMDDLHKPELDQIGFQDLMAEQLAWWNTVMSPSSSTILHRDAIGKQTAWINYQTAVDRVYGDFAKQEGYSFMVLNRQYEHDPERVWNIKDVTTYIDPAKYNYAFAYTDLAAQNFWVNIQFKVVSRRKMGAQQLPNL